MPALGEDLVILLAHGASQQQIREGIAILADVCCREFGGPTRSANLDRREAWVSVTSYPMLILLT